MHRTQEFLKTKLTLKFTSSNKESIQDDIIGTLISEEDQKNTPALSDNLLVHVKKELEAAEELDKMKIQINSSPKAVEKPQVVMDDSVHINEDLEMNKNEEANESSNSSISTLSFDIPVESLSDYEKSHISSPSVDNNRKKRSHSQDDSVSEEIDHKPKKNKKLHKEPAAFNFQRFYKHADFVQDIKYVGDGRLVSCAKGKIRLWDIKKGKMLYETNFDAFRLFVTSKKSIIAAGNNLCAVLVWDPDKRANQIFKTRGIVTSIEELGNGVLVFGERLISGHGFVNDLTFLELNNSSLEYLSTIENAHEDTIQWLKALPGNYLASSSKDNCLKIWRKDSKDRYVQTRILIGHNNTVTGLEVFDGKLISSSYDKTIRIWDYETGICLNIVETRKVYHQIILFDNFLAFRPSLQANFFDVYESKEFKFVKEYPIKHLHSKHHVELLLLIDKKYFASTSKGSINLFDFQSDLVYIKNGINDFEAAVSK